MMLTSKSVSLLGLATLPFALAAPQEDPESFVPSSDPVNSVEDFSEDDCIVVKNSFFCSDERWSTFVLDRRLAVFDNQDTLTPENADAVMEKVVEQVQEKLPEKAGCGGDLDLLRARTYNCHIFIESSIDRCRKKAEKEGKGGASPAKACKNVCKQYVDSGVRGLTDEPNCPDQAKARKWLGEYEQSIKCGLLPDTDCVGEEMEAGTCGLLKLESICTKCQEPSKPLLAACSTAQRKKFNDADSAAAGSGPSTTIIAASVGAGIAVLLLMFGAFLYFRVIRRRRQKARAAGAAANFSAKGSDEGLGNGPNAATAPRNRNSVVAPVIPADVKQRSVERNMGTFTPPSMNTPKQYSVSEFSPIHAARSPPMTTNSAPMPAMEERSDPINAANFAASAAADYRRSKFSQVSRRSSSQATDSQPSHTPRNDGAAVYRMSSTPSAAGTFSPGPQDPDASVMSSPSRPTSGNMSKYNIDPTRYVVVYRYARQQPDEMDLEPGQKVLVTTLYDDGWALGRNDSTGVSGALPQACILVDEST